MGQLRIWPGGMANARAIGDFGAGHLLISSPHITQVLLPCTLQNSIVNQHKVLTFRNSVVEGFPCMRIFQAFGRDPRPTNL